MLFPLPVTSLILQCILVGDSFLNMIIRVLLITIWRHRC